MKIGILALQGDFIEHQVILDGLGVDTVQVRLSRDLEGLSGLVIPGGESTTIGKLTVDFGLLEPLRQFGMRHAVWGTCAGAIFLSGDAHRQQPLLGLMDIVVQRNAFGHQVDSFEINIDIACLRHLDPAGKPFPAVFIRAPLIESVGKEVETLATLPDGRIVAAQQGNLLATAFHPELTGDNRFHRYFLELAGS
jgi:5'-phosphate synthase pdxT subunit